MANESELHSILNVANAAAKPAVKCLRRYWTDGFELRNKAEQGGKSYDLVSDADIESQQAVASRIAAAFPTHELMGEEDLVGDTTSDHLWIIDPLDGTNNFAHHVPHFAVSIGYFRDGRPAAGVVLNPITGHCYTAGLGLGAWCDGEPIHVASSTSLSECLIGCGFYYDRGEMMRSTLAAIEEFFSHDIHGIRRFGTAALDLCAVASGMFGAFFEYKLSPWDFAAGQLIVTEAGGTITNATGGPLGLVPSSVLASNGALHPSALAITQKHA